jgi:hypothetical protein
VTSLGGAIFCSNLWAIVGQYTVHGKNVPVLPGLFLALACLGRLKSGIFLILARHFQNLGGVVMKVVSFKK